MDNIEELQSVISQPQKIVITMHHKPDADALGSSLAWANFLLKLGHEVSVIAPSDYPDFLNWMHGNDDVIIFGPQTQATVQQKFDNATLVCCLDFSAYKRVDSMQSILENVKAPILLVDHHLDPTIEPKYKCWDTEAAATAQLIYRLINALGHQDKLDVHIGEAIYAGILTDTGGFKHPVTSQEVHEIVGQLIALGVDNSKVNCLIYDNNSLERMRFLGFVLYNKLQIIEDLGVAYITISKEDLKEFHSKTGDTEGVVNYALSIKGIRMAAIIIDRSDKVKMSFRSIGDIPVNQFAKNHFNGGGHKNAAGGVSFDPLEQTIQQFLTHIRQDKSLFQNA